MSRRTPDPTSAKSAVEAKRNALDNAILEHLRSHGQATQSKAIAQAIGASWTAIVGRLHALVRVQAVRRSDTGKDRAGKPIITFQAIRPEHIAPRRHEQTFRPLRTPPPTVIPVRSQGRIAINPQTNEAPLTFGRGAYQEIA